MTEERHLPPTDDPTDDIADEAAEAVDEPVGETAVVGEDPIAAAQADAAAQRDEYLGLLQRVQAEFDNYRKRALREREEAERQATSRLLAEMLPVLDDLERAAALAAGPDLEPGALAPGLDLVRRKLSETLVKHGVAEIPALGEPFDPHVHEALLSRVPDAGQAEGTVIEVFSPGFTLHGRVVRPARVVVAGEA